MELNIYVGWHVAHHYAAIRKSIQIIGEALVI